MEWSEIIQEHINKLKPSTIDAALLQRLISLLDYTSLNHDDTENTIAAFCTRARTIYSPVAAVCVLPAFVSIAKATLAGTTIRVATVANFPEGNNGLDDVLAEIGQAQFNGADEIDVVFPYHRYLAGERQYAQEFVRSCKAAAGPLTLKVILETGALIDLPVIIDATHDVIAAGASFVKTATGKMPTGATLEAAAALLLVVKHLQPSLNYPIGIKVSGRIRDVQFAAKFLELADKILGQAAVLPQTFRLGASGLLEKLLIKN